MSIITFIIIGLIAGWLASLIMRGRGFGVAGDIIVGVLGALIGGLVFNQFGVGTESILGAILTALVGAIILLFFVGLVRRREV